MSYASSTIRGIGTHWWQADLANRMIVQQVYLRASTDSNGDTITVALYSGKKVVGKCETHTGKSNGQYLACDKVSADRVRLEAISTYASAGLSVYEIKVTGVLDPTSSGTALTASVFIVTTFLAWLAL